MTLGLDTSIALRLLTGVPEAQAARARALVASATGAVAISDLVVGETYFALRHHYSVPHAEAVRALRALLDDPKVRGTGTARSVLADPATLSTAKTNVGVLDRLIRADYDREGLTLATFDRTLARLAGVQLVE